MDGVKMPLPLQIFQPEESFRAHSPLCSPNLIISAFLFSCLCIPEIRVLQVTPLLLGEMDPFLHLLST